jgi:hypothetical protein
MPNKRAKNKVLLGAFVDRNLKAAFLETAHAHGLTASDAILTAIHNYVKCNGNVSMTGPAPTQPPRAIESDLPHDLESSTTPQEPQPSNSSTVDDVWLL